MSLAFPFSHLLFTNAVDNQKAYSGLEVWLRGCAVIQITSLLPQPHNYYCGIDPHVRAMSVRILDQHGTNKKIGSPQLKWVFSEASVLLLRQNKLGQDYFAQYLSESLTCGRLHDMPTSETKKRQRPRAPVNKVTVGFRVSAELRAMMEPLPPRRKNRHRFGGGRPRVSARWGADAIFYMLRTGCQWGALDTTDLYPHSTAHDRFQAWVAAGKREFSRQSSPAEGTSCNNVN